MIQELEEVAPDPVIDNPLNHRHMNSIRRIRIDEEYNFIWDDTTREYPDASDYEEETEFSTHDAY